MNENKLSNLFLFLINNRIADNRKIITQLLLNGAIIKNGNILPPDKLPKLLTQNASANILKTFFRFFYSQYNDLIKNNLIVEVGSGDGYLKYLLSIANDPILENIKNLIIETESSEKVVQDNLKRGKYTIQKEISDLVDFFGNSFTPCVISMNVMDTFSYEDLNKNMHSINNLLKNNGLFIHIMSSSIYPDIYKEIENQNTAKIIFPYYKNGYVGLRLIDRENTIKEINEIINRIPYGLYELFANEPSKYIEISNIITLIIDNNKIDSEIVIFQEFFLDKIKKSFTKTGFKLIYQEELSSDEVTICNQYHKKLPDMNYFNNILGSLIVDKYDHSNLSTNTVLEKSTFYIIMGQKIEE